ncbi:enoyl-CoA hydratase [Advenella kashmirensis W13003]|uniref:Enoyl-CoA hydratase n=1 Tax=Advenella kashmirensis W13003 TaxID=1424334 RepID=V8QYK8_9BURK|nr:enoyl-CoA hydratase-related protein [Advenella kashmirensis]ETF04463.1 enoyl-CoA hydratase [Advenella kashmirensis W13003]
MTDKNTQPLATACPEQSELVKSDLSGAVAKLILNRADRLNAMTPAMDSQLRSAFLAAQAAKHCKVILITGAGKGFCSGADQTATQPAEAADTGWQQVPRHIDEFRFGYLMTATKPTIAAVNGAAIGVGLVLASLCDIRLAVSDAKLGFPYARLGLIAEYGIAHRLTNLVGHGVATELLLSGRLFDAIEAFGFGLINHVAERDRFEKFVNAYTQELSTRCSPRSMRVIKQQLLGSQTQSFMDAARQSGRELTQARQSADYAAAKNARREKRLPSFTEE